jgi:hypothetical protein
MVITFGGLGALGGVVCDGRRRRRRRYDTAAAAAIARHRVYGLLIEERSCKRICCKVLLCCMEVLNGKAQLWLEKLITQLLRHLRERRVAKANQLRAVVFKYVSSCGGWKRAFPSSLNGDVYVPFHFNFETTPDYWVEENFRLPRQDIDRVRALLGIPEVVCTHNRDCIPGFLAFCMVLYKLSWPRRMSDLRDTFGGTKQRCSRIVNHVVVFLYLRFYPKMSTLDRMRYTDDYLLYLCSAGLLKHEVMDNIWGFIDATIRPCARPVRFQKVVYNGKNRVHSIKFQSIVSWDGMIAHLSGPWAGARHDSGIFNESPLPVVLGSLPCVPSPGNPPVALYADEGYALSPRIFVPYADGRVCARHAAFNHRMSQSRITVEWGYHMVLRSWTSLDFKRNLKIFKSPIGAYYAIAVLLTNIQSCLATYNDITLYAGTSPPSVEEYLASLATEPQPMQ